MFNEKQQEAINSLEGRIRVIAGAGSGKTGVLTHRYAELIKKGVKPENILCVTFTNKAANEMKERIYKLVEKECKLDLITTFHGFCLRILRENSYLLGWDSTFKVLDGDDQNAIIRDVYKECKIDKDEVSYKAAKDIITDFKVNKEYYLLNVFKPDGSIKRLYEDAKETCRDSFLADNNDIAKEIYFGYLYHQQKAYGIDFNDMIILTCIILSENKGVLAEWQKQLKYVMVDEFQDASLRQYQLVSMLTEKSGNLFVVGDPDQTIYSWRGAKPELLVNFDKEKKTKTIIMNQNYRSTPNILDIANTIIDKNKLRVKKELFTKNPKGDKVTWAHFDGPKEEAEWIANKIKTLLKKHKPKDIVILYRMHFLSRSIEEQLIKQKIPYTIHSGTNFYERKEIKDILSYLRVLSNPKDDLSLKRIINTPTRGIGYKKIEELQKYANIANCSLWESCNHFIKLDKNTKLQDFVFMINYLTEKSKTLNLKELIKEILDKSTYGKLLEQNFEEERLQNVSELISSLNSFDKDITLDKYLQEVALLTNTDKKTRDVVTLMTIHSAKGLEFPVVFVIGMSEGQFPCTHSYDSMEEGEEERRLAYVAYTRAKEKLFLTDCGGYDFNGNDRHTSRYIKDVIDDVEVIKKDKNPLNVFKPRAYVVKKQKDYDMVDEERITDATLYNPSCDIRTCMTSKAIRNTKDRYSRSGKFHGQYFDSDGNYYDWDDDTYCQGLVNAEDIFDASDFC